MYTRNKQIDFFKGIAIIMILLAHSTQRIEGLNLVNQLFSFGQMGCQIFFLISGYTISLSWKRYKEKHSKLSFLIHRAGGILTGWYLAIFITHLINIILEIKLGKSLGFGQNNEFISIICNLLFLNGLLPFCNNNVVAGGWFIGTLIILYILTPTLYELVKKYNRKVSLSVIFFIFSLIIAEALNYIFKIDISNNSFYYFNFINQISCYTLGIELYFNYEDKRFSNKIYLILFVCCFIVSTLIFYFPIFNISYEIVPYIFSVSIYCYIKTSAYKINILESTVIENFGKNTYYIYLVHCFFCYTFPIGIQIFLNKINLVVEPIIIYIICLPFMLIFSYYVAIKFKKICIDIQGEIIWKRLMKTKR